MNDGGFDVHDAKSATASNNIEPPIFVLYANGGIVAFANVRQAIQKVAPRDYDLINGVWDSRGQTMHYALDNRRRLLVMDAVPPNLAKLREVLAAQLATVGDSDLDDLDIETLVARAQVRFGLKGFSEMLSEHLLPHLLSPG